MNEYGILMKIAKSAKNPQYFCIYQVWICHRYNHYFPLTWHIVIISINISNFAWIWHLWEKLEAPGSHYCVVFCWIWRTSTFRSETCVTFPCYNSVMPIWCPDCERPENGLGQHLKLYFPISCPAALRTELGFASSQPLKQVLAGARPLWPTWRTRLPLSSSVTAETDPLLHFKNRSVFL